MDEAERERFLSRPLTAIVSTVGKDGTPRGVPVWFLYEVGRVIIWTDARRGWVRNIARLPQVAVTIAEHEPPFAAIVLRGVATVESNRRDALDIIRRVTEKYIPPADVDAYIRGYAALTTIVEVDVQAHMGWGRGY